MPADEEMDDERSVDVDMFGCLGVPNVPTKAMVSVSAVVANCPRIVFSSPLISLSPKTQLAKI